jgi:fatty-acyl-CoA synthase
MQPLASYVHGAHHVPLIGETIGAYLDAVAARFGASEALVIPHQDVRWTYAEFNDRVTLLAAGLLRLGLQPGDRIGIWSQNRAEWVLTQFATARAGLIMVNINPSYRRSELEYVLDKVDCSALILAPSFKSSDYIAMLQDVVPELHHARPGALHSERLPNLRHVIRLGADSTPGMFNFDELSAAIGADHLAYPRGSRPPCSSTMPSTSSSPAARQDRRRASR